MGNKDLEERNIDVVQSLINEREALRIIKRNENNRKAEIMRKLQVIMDEKKEIEKQEASVSSVHDRIKLDKKLAVVQNDLQKAESALFMDKMRIEYEAEQEVKKLPEDKEVYTEIKRIFKIEVKGIKDDG